MILPGMRLAIVMGWLTSVIILVKPWGTPKFQWKSLPIFFCLMYLPFFILVNVDLVYHYYKESDNGTNNSYNKLDRIDNIVTTLTFLELLISDILLRLVFLWKAADFADLLRRLRLYNESKSKDEGYSPTSKIDITITIVVYLSTYTTCTMEGINIYKDGSGRFILRDYIGALPHTIIIVLLYYLPMMIPMKCAFSVILASSGYLSTIIKDYTQHVLDSVSERKWEGMSITNKGKEIEALQLRKPTNVKPFRNERRLILLERFDIVQDIFTLAHGIISPLAFVMLGGSSIAVVMKAYEVGVLSHGNDWVYVVKDVCHLINYICYFWILQAGQRITDVISNCKEKLEDKYLQLSEETHQMERQTLKDILSLLKYWDWKFTACDFFVIDRSLASGVVSLIMTYVVVLVQLKVQEEPNTISA